MAPDKAALPALRAALQHYPAVLAAKAGVSKARGYDLEALDAWYRGELAPALQRRGAEGTAHVTSEELKRLMQWKLARGNWRPRLEDLIASNAASEVERVSRLAFSQHAAHLTDASSPYGAREMRAVLEAWKPLKGVGAATATALMAAYAPRHYAFMSDEGLTSVGMEHKYTFPHALAYCEAMLKRAEETKLDLKELEQAAYALVAGRKHAPQLVAGAAEEAGAKKATATKGQSSKPKAAAASTTAKGEAASDSKAASATSDTRPAQKRKAPASSSGAEAGGDAEPRRRSARLR